jgi:NAD(P)-dependent dehydrogenase (short-subunit alcohol dehydrogenase family)
MSDQGGGPAPADERVVLVTGGGGGIGAAVASRFLSLGDRVVLADISSDALANAVETLPGPVTSVAADVRVVADCDRMVAQAVETGGRLDVLVNCAGVWVEGPSVEMREDQWDRTIGVNLKGTFFSSRAAIPHLMRTGGCIVNISSDSGLGGNPGCAIYNASKFGVSGLTASMGLELAPHGVRVNAVCPADVDTPMLASQVRDFGGGDEQVYLDALLAKYPAAQRARFIRPEEVAALVAFLASEDAAPITAACIPIEFGLTAGY